MKSSVDRKDRSDASSAEKPTEPKEETISSPKRSRGLIRRKSPRKRPPDNLRVAAETLPRTGGEAAVIAPIAGRLVVEKTFAVGTAVEKSAELASIVPPTSTRSDLAGLQLAENEATFTLEQAQRDRARAQRLLTAGAVPARRAEEARTVEATAARLQLRKPDSQYTRPVQRMAPKPASEFLVRAPISGILSDRPL
jgi:biotin carboxyl carrier protein